MYPDTLILQRKALRPKRKSPQLFSGRDVLRPHALLAPTLELLVRLGQTKGCLECQKAKLGGHLSAERSH